MVATELEFEEDLSFSMSMEIDHNLVIARNRQSESESDGSSKSGKGGGASTKSSKSTSSKSGKWTPPPSTPPSTQPTSPPTPPCGVAVCECLVTDPDQDDNCPDLLPRTCDDEVEFNDLCTATGSCCKLNEDCDNCFYRDDPDDVDSEVGYCIYRRAKCG